MHEGNLTIGTMYDHGEMQKVRATLCAGCKAASHSLGRCKARGCDQLVWQCARVTHVALRHPIIVQQRERGLEQAAKSNMRYLGRINYALDPALDVELKKTIFQGGGPE